MAETESTWKKSRDFLAQQPGYLNTRLHKNIDDKGRYQLINVAEWATANEFRAASKAMETSGVPKMPEGVKFVPGLFRVIDN